ncbi:MAG: Holliday junction resolvase RuvX [Spirochaetae bacterium HGW-Spirochaetae-6]|nr:MAG: Holliday junction resolvase RuvX [Spirochaetae bacterium HGW-Spirochaetae-6]
MKQLNLLALDFGEKKIGVALKRSGRQESEPLGNIKSQGDIISKIIHLVKSHHIHIILLGYPLLEHGKKSATTAKVEKFSSQLLPCLPQNVELKMVDEAFTTQQTILRLRALGKNERFIALNKDSYAARLLIERVMDHEGI